RIRGGDTAIPSVRGLAERRRHPDRALHLELRVDPPLLNATVASVSALLAFVAETSPGGAVHTELAFPPLPHNVRLGNVRTPHQLSHPPGERADASGEVDPLPGPQVVHELCGLFRAAEHPGAAVRQAQTGPHVDLRAELE